jgi:hypothetical protein
MDDRGRLWPDRAHTIAWGCKCCSGLQVEHLLGVCPIIVINRKCYARAILSRALQALL